MNMKPRIYTVPFALIPELKWACEHPVMSWIGFGSTPVLAWLNWRHKNGL